MPNERRIRLRIGVNLGDVIVEDHDIFGDGVNVAARLEGLAEPGGICLSRMVRDQIRDKLPYPFEDMGEQSVKNIARPVRAYALRPEGLVSPSRPGPAAQASRRTERALAISSPLIFRRIGPATRVGGRSLRDSPLEGNGFELLVPRHKSRGFPQHSGHGGGSTGLLSGTA